MTRDDNSILRALDDLWLLLEASDDLPVGPLRSELCVLSSTVYSRNGWKRGVFNPPRLNKLTYMGFAFRLWPDEPELCIELGLKKNWVRWELGWCTSQMYEVLHLGPVQFWWGM
jgi:hypothetical protein